jgi:hypothetical protein
MRRRIGHDKQGGRAACIVGKDDPMRADCFGATTNADWDRELLGEMALLEETASLIAQEILD